MKFLFHDCSSELKTTEPMGVLKVEVPHWTAQVQIFDYSFKPIANIGKIKADPDSESGYSTDTTLAPGVYQIQTTLEGKTESEWFPVSEGKITQVSHEVWDKLDFTSSVPIRKTISTSSRKTRRTPADKIHEKHLQAAQEWSSNVTWSDSEGNSSLFLFLRTDENEQIEERSAEGLQLLNTKGELITDFSGQSVKKDKKAGWLAFNAKLPAGSYVLRRGRSGVKLRHQIVHLCDKWQTQIFVKARRFPSLKTWSVGMARGGFNQYHDETSTAAEAILNALRHGSSFQTLFNNEIIQQSLDALLHKKLGNPWLGVLAAYAISKLREEVDDEDRKEDLCEYFSIFTEKLLPFLTQEIPTHPDVQALGLPMDQPAALPFDSPPMLLASLKRVQFHATQFVDTIPADSLTDCVIENLVLNSPWTAWRSLPYYPGFDADHTEKNLSVFFSKKSSIRKVEADPAVNPFLQNSPAKAPVYYLADDEPESGSDTQSDSPTQAQPSAVQFFQHTPIVQKAIDIVQEYVQNDDVQNIPEKITLDSELTNRLLDKVTSADVSSNYNLPLSRVENELTNLKEQSSLPASDSPAAMSSTQSSAQQAILSFALNQIDDETAKTDDESDSSEGSLKHMVSRICKGAERLWVRAEQTGDDQQFSKKIARRLKEFGNRLLRRADFVFITDQEGKILYGNGSFKLLLTQANLGDSEEPAEEPKKKRSLNRKEWERVLKELPAGTNEIPNPNDDKILGSVSIQRSLMEESTSNNASAYLNIMRSSGLRNIEQKELQQINSITANLTLYTLLLTYGSKSDTREYRAALKEMVEQLEALESKIPEEAK